MCALCNRLFDRRDLRELRIPIPRPPDSAPGLPQATAFILVCQDDAERLAAQATREAIRRGLEPPGGGP